MTEEEQDEPTAVLIEPEETATSTPEPPAETELTKSEAADETTEEAVVNESREGRVSSPITVPEKVLGENTDTAPTIEEEPYEPTVVKEVTAIQEQSEVTEDPPTQAAEPIYNPSLGKRPYEEPVDEHGIGVNADDLVGPDGLRCGEGIHF